MKFFFLTGNLEMFGGLKFFSVLCSCKLSLKYALLGFDYWIQVADGEPIACFLNLNLHFITDKTFTVALLSFPASHIIAI